MQPDSESVRKAKKGHESLDELERKLRILLGRYEQMAAELRAERAQNQQLKLTVDKQRETIRSFQNQVKVSNIVASIAHDTPASDALRRTIDGYLQEIDRCIAYLSDQ